MNTYKRVTREKDCFPCRFPKSCYDAGQWMEEATGELSSDWRGSENECANCPYEQYVNAFAEIEDKIEAGEDYSKELKEIEFDRDKLEEVTCDWMKEVTGFEPENFQLLFFNFEDNPFSEIFKRIVELKGE